jgi:type IV pilus assembly protein PilC
MPVFTFSGKNSSGEKISGERVAANKQVLANQLRREQIAAPTIREKGKEFAMPTFGSGRVKVKEIAIFFRQFSVMIDAGLPLVQCLEILGANQENPTFQKTLIGVRTTVEGGATLANAMRQFPKVFDDLTTNMIEAGETGGILDIILQRLSTFIEKIVKLKRDVMSAMIYPTAVILLAICAVAVIMIVVIPQFKNIFLGLLGPGEQLPLPTRIVVGISNFLAGWGGLVILAVIIAVGVAIKFYYGTPNGRRVIDALLLKIPIIGPIFRKISVARFSRTLSTLLSSGVPILQSLDITARTSGNVIIESAITKVRAGVERGENFVDPLKATEVFPHMVAQMIGIGEQTGALDAMLGKIADFYESEVDSAIANLLTLIEPLLIGFLGVTIGSIVIAMYLPLFTLIGKLSQGH